MKERIWLLLLCGLALGGCVSGPLPEKAAWPWETTKDYDKIQTGNFISVRGNVAHFDESPKAVKPVKPEDLNTPASEPYPVVDPSLTKRLLSPPAAESESDHENTKNRAKDEYDFTIRNIKISPPSYLPSDQVSSSYDITAFNHGNAPVSVTFGIDPTSAQNISTDKTLPVNSVVPPHSDKVLVRIGPKVKGESYNFRSTYSWSIGDYTARHDNTSHYQFPFSAKIKALASVNNTSDGASTRYSVVFSMPAGTKALAARKGTVIQIRRDKVDIIHDDSTIATYSHLEQISGDISIGKEVTTEEIIGVVGTTADRKEGYLQMTVWRPEPLAGASLKAIAPSEGFAFVSLPLEFCSSDSNKCRVLTQDQMVSRNGLNGTKKMGMRSKDKRKDKLQP